MASVTFAATQMACGDDKNANIALAEADKVKKETAILKKKTTKRKQERLELERQVKYEIKTVQTLRCNHKGTAVIKHIKIMNKPVSELAVSVKYKPYLFDMFTGIAESEIACSFGYFNFV